MRDLVEPTETRVEAKARQSEDPESISGLYWRISVRAILVHGKEDVAKKIGPQGVDLATAKVLDAAIGRKGLSE